MKTQTVGYIVECEGRHAMVYHEGQLYFGREATLFPTRRAAGNAIRTTRRRRKAEFGRDFDEEFGRLSIRRATAGG